MKKITLFVLAFFALLTTYAQTPQQFKYQAVLRDVAGNVIANQNKTVVVDILQSSASGNSVFNETHNVLTTSQGLINLNIGSIESLSGIDWSSDLYFIQITVDGVVMGTSQLLSVPYALNSKNTENFSGTITESQISDFGNYLTSYTETDPIFGASPSAGILNSDISNWNTAYSWGNHASAGYLTSYTETDPIFSNSAAFGITSTNISNWNTAYSWGNHATAGYLTSYTETDPTFSTSAAFGISSTNISNWNTAYAWGNHATAGYLTSEVDGSTTNEIELPNQSGNSGKFLTTNGTSPSWLTITKTSVGLGNVENTALSTWAGSSNITTLGTISTGTWQGTAIGATYIGSLPASQITSGVFDNARINWAAPGTVGSTTPNTGAFTSLSANNGFSVTNGTINLKPAGSGGTNGYVLTTDGAGNATWKAATASPTPMSVTVQNSNYTIQITDGLIITNGGTTFTLPSAALAGAGKIIYLYSKVSSITLTTLAGDTIWDNSGNSHTSPATMTTYSGCYISDGVNTWYEVCK